MPDPDFLRDRLPALHAALPRFELAPLREHTLRFASRERRLAVKYDNLTGELYGGNKIRKLEYILPRARAKNCLRIATFGAAGSNHALATALYARQAGFACTCFLSHQAMTPLVAAALNMHIRNKTELVRYGGTYRTRLQTLRSNLWGRRAWVIPMGGSSWLGTIGFVAAGLELAAQVGAGKISAPDRLYVGAGTMGTAVGIALGLALAGMQTEVQAVRVSDVSIMNATKLRTLLDKTALMMRHHDPSVPVDLASRARIRIRNEFFGTGYARGTRATAEAITFAEQELGLHLESTYTGKALSALLSDWRQPQYRDTSVLYWHTYNSAALDVPADKPLDASALPAGFIRYFAT